MLTMIPIALVICGCLLMFSRSKEAAFFGALSIVACFGYRYLIGGEELQAIIAEALFCVAVLPIAWRAVKEFQQITKDPRN